MIKYFVKNDNEILHHLCVYINDPIYNLEMSFIIEYKNKTNKINKIKFFKKNETYILLPIFNDHSPLKELSEFEILFNNKYTEILSAALKFKNGNKLLEKIVYKYNILNINGEKS